MNSHPHEFLAHHAPLMFVAGLGTSTTSLAQLSKSTTAPSSRRESLTNSINPPGSTTIQPEAPSLDGLKITGFDLSPGTPMKSRSRAGSTAIPPPNDAPSEVPVIPEIVAPEQEPDEFELLKTSLRDVFVKGQERARVWPADIKPDSGGRFGMVKKGEVPGGTNTRRRMDWRVVLVDKNIRFPPKKVVPPPPPSSITAPPLITTPHSPFSPLTPNSVVYPDGLITPTWIRKHTETLPSVILLFERLFEADHVDPKDIPIPVTPQSSSGTNSPVPPSLTGSITSGVSAVSGTTEKEMNQRKREREKKADEELVASIAEKRKRWVERIGQGVKVTVVLMASREALDDSALDARLSFIRRQSGLDTRASLFVLTPVGEDELEEFVTSLREALHESSQEFYALHYKRNRRKRSRLPSNPNQLPYPVNTLPGMRPLGALGWAVRYDYKAGVFAEIRGDFDIARRGYEDAWYGLVSLFASNGALPPRTKRWAEAKVLADCTALKICRLFLYYQDTSASLSFLQQHLSRFSDLSRGWGIGGDAFEFWAWIARQYRMFAELLEMATGAGLKLDTSLPAYLPTSPNMASPGGSPLPENVLVSSNIPSATLQHPGYYFYAAANCSVNRRDRFIEANEAEAEKSNSKLAAAPGFVNEQKVDHTALIVELFTKAYGHFKQYERSQTRMSLYIAHRIAECYSQAGQDDLCMRYCERMAKAYVREQWTPVLWSIRSVWYQAAQRTGAVESAARLLLDMMSPRGGPPPEDPTQYQEDLQALMTTTTPASEAGLDIDMTKAAPLFNVSACFMQEQVELKQDAGCVVQIHVPITAQFDELALSQIEIKFSHGLPSLIVQHAADALTSHAVSLSVTEPAKANLNVRPGHQLFLTGSITADEAVSIQVTDVILTMNTSSWNIHFHSYGSLPVVRELDSATTFPQVSFADLPVKVETKITVPDIVYRADPAPISCKITNMDKKPVRLTLQADIRDAGSDIESPTISGQPTIRIDEVEKDITFQDYDLPLIGPGEQIEVFLHVTSNVAATQVLAVALRESDQVTITDALQFASIASTNVAFVEPLKIDQDIWFAQASNSTPLTEGQDGRAEAFAAFDVRMIGELDVTVVGITFQHENLVESSTVLKSSSAADSTFPMTWKKRDLYSLLNQYELNATSRDSLSLFEGLIDIEWQTSRSASKTCHTKQPFRFKFEAHQHVSCVLMPPTQVTIGVPFAMELVITNDHEVLETHDLTIQVEPSKSFSWSDTRQLPLPAIKPGDRWTHVYETSPVGAGTGWQPLPRFKVSSVENGLKRDIAIKDGRDSGRSQTEAGGLPVFVRP